MTRSRFWTLVILITAIVLISACTNSTSTTAPDYVGSWSATDIWGDGTGTVTMTLAATTQHWAVAGGSYGGGWVDFSVVVDEALKHMTLTVTNISSGPDAFVTGIASPVDTKVYITYAIISGTTLQLAVSTTSSFPDTATSGSQTASLTKL